MENVATLQKINLEMESLADEETRVKNLQIKLQKSLGTIDSDLARENSITLDASVNEKRILEEKNELLETEKRLHDTEDKSMNDLNKSKTKLNEFKSELDNLINEMEIFIDKGKQISKETLSNLKSLINQITLAQENYASFYGKNESIKSDSLSERKG